MEAMPAGPVQPVSRMLDSASAHPDISRGSRHPRSGSRVRDVHHVGVAQLQVRAVDRREDHGGAGRREVAMRDVADRAPR